MSKLPFGKRNYQLMILGLIILVVGYTIMTLDTEPHGFGVLGLTVGPIIVMAGFIVEIFAILHRPSDRQVMSLVQAIILAIIEGITEFLPISSTGHMIIGSTAMGIAADPFVKAFTIAIQFGAITSVIVLYWARFWQSLKFYFVLAVAFIPAAIIGFLVNDLIDTLLERADVVGWTLIAGGIVLLFVDKFFERTIETGSTAVSYPRGLKIGLFQCLALIPGVSRSAATIIGGLAVGLNRRTAAEFSFFLAIPTMLTATVYKLGKFYLEGNVFGPDQWMLLAVGNVVAFLVAMAAIKLFIGYLTRHGFRIFGYYRIIVGLVILLLYYFGADLQML